MMGADNPRATLRARAHTRSEFENPGAYARPCADMCVAMRAAMQSACALRRWKALVSLSTNTSMPVQQTCDRRCRYLWVSTDIQICSRHAAPWCSAAVPMQDHVLHDQTCRHIHRHAVSHKAGMHHARSKSSHQGSHFVYQHADAQARYMQSAVPM